jgi:hypothetical protein
MAIIAVFGSAGGEELVVEKNQISARIIGEEVARRGHYLLTGACPGIPHIAALGALEESGIVIGISPYGSKFEHVNNGFPIDSYLLIFTGMTKKGRNPISCRTADAAIFVSGRTGTLNEFSIFYDEGNVLKVIGLLRGTGGVVDNEIPSLLARLSRDKPSKVTVIEDDEPKRLVEAVCVKLQKNLRV